MCSPREGEIDIQHGRFHRRPIFRKASMQHDTLTTLIILVFALVEIGTLYLVVTIHARVWNIIAALAAFECSLRTSIQEESQKREDK